MSTMTVEDVMALGCQGSALRIRDRRGDGAAAEQVNQKITQPESSPRIAANAGAQAKLTFVGAP